MSSKKAAPTTKFPKFIHVTRENEGTDDAYYDITTGTAEQAISSRERTRVATYELKEVKEGKLEPVFSTIVG